MTSKALTDEDYQALRGFRSGLRRFIRWSTERAADAGLTPAQHQLLLVVRGHPTPDGPTIGDIAYDLLVRHHSAVELIDRAEAVGLVKRSTDPLDQRIVRVTLTKAGANRLDSLTELHVEELSRLAPRFRSLWLGLDPSLLDAKPPSETPGRRRDPSRAGSR